MNVKHLGNLRTKHASIPSIVAGNPRESHQQKMLHCQERHAQSLTETPVTKQTHTVTLPHAGSHTPSTPRPPLFLDGNYSTCPTVTNL